MERGFDHEWRLRELLDTADCQKIGPALLQLLGGDLAITDDTGYVLWEPSTVGQAAAEAAAEAVAEPAARREPLILELEALGYLSSRTAETTALAAARRLVQSLLRAQMRFKMASTLHLEAVAEDFESLKREHARLSESEARYKALSEELETRVKQQVAELEERQQRLYLAEKLASVGQLAAGMAHEINNPLGFARSNLSTFGKYIAQFAELKSRLENLEKGECAESAGRAWQTLDLDFIVEDSIDLLHDSAQGLERIARIVADLKEFSNIDHASEEFADLNDCLQKSASIIEKQLPIGIVIRFDLRPLPQIICLPGHLNQLFFNILRNALQAIKDAARPGQITVSSEAKPDSIVIRIHDDGVGMTPEQREHAFEPFYTLRPVGAGVGLGLATARNVVLAHGGEISLDSQPGAGTTVTLSFPVL
jgi:signal transduction histidine kinase